jgi:ubiquitin-activating enzyme E1
VTSSGALFWSGPKRVPTPIVFDPKDQLHMDFIIASANLRAFNYGIKGHADKEQITVTLSNIIVPEFSPKSGVKIAVQESEANAVQSVSESELENVIKALPLASTLTGFRLNACEFEKVYFLI